MCIRDSIFFINHATSKQSVRCMFYCDVKRCSCGRLNIVILSSHKMWFCDQSADVHWRRLVSRGLGRRTEMLRLCEFGLTNCGRILASVLQWWWWTALITDHRVPSSAFTPTTMVCCCMHSVCLSVCLSVIISIFTTNSPSVASHSTRGSSKERFRGACRPPVRDLALLLPASDQIFVECNWTFGKKI